MQMPNNYNETQARGDFMPISLGGHILVIKEVTEQKSKAGKPMIKVCFDTAAEDVQAHYFSDLYRNDTREDKKWSNIGTAYILTEDNEGSCRQDFKTFCVSVEKSNAGFSIQWGDNFCACLRDKRIGGVFGIVEEEYNGEVKKRHKLRWFTNTEGIKEVETPAPRLLKDKNAAYNASSDGFMNVPDEIDADLPFN